MNEAEERAKFEAAHKHLHLGRAAPSFGNYRYAYPMVDALWEGWKARATLAPTVPTEPVAITEMQREWNRRYSPRAQQTVQDEPVAWIFTPNNELLWPSEVEATNPIEIDSYRPLYTSPPQRKPLLADEVDKIADSMAGHDRYTFAAAIEAAHGIKESE